ncbi:MAG: hypothetical protein QM757_23260 [Paludibaculum sp.]
MFSLAHFLVDVYFRFHGCTSQPFLVARYGLKLSEAGLIGGLLVFSSSVTQPIYGYLKSMQIEALLLSEGPWWPDS